MQKLPPIEKIYEAYSAIADERVTLLAEQAIILSSNRTREYTVIWSGTTYSANDSATYWQGYAGYPVIAVLMLQGRLPLNRDIAGKFAGINWTELNALSKRDYAKAVDTAFEQLHYDKDTQKELRMEAGQVYEALKKLDIRIKRASPRPPKYINKDKE